VIVTPSLPGALGGGLDDDEHPAAAPVAAVAAAAPASCKNSRRFHPCRIA
jgi:hypothetical protein